MVLRGNALPFGDQEAVGCDCQCSVVMETRPAAALIAPEADFLLEVLIIALDAPAHLGEIDKAAERHVRVDGCEPGLGGSGVALGPLYRPANDASGSGRKPWLSRCRRPACPRRLPFGIVFQPITAPRGRRAVDRWGGSGSLAFFVRFEFRQGLFLECEVGVQISLRRLDRFMTEPKRDYGAIDAGLQQLHRGVSAPV
jgi:hypothetical protein